MSLLRLLSGFPVAATAGWEFSDLAPDWWVDETTSVTDVSGRASQWNDRSGNGWHITQSTAGKRPLITTATLNGSKRVLHFQGPGGDANGDMMHTGTSGNTILSNKAQGWIFGVYSKASSEGAPASLPLLAVNTATASAFRLAYMQGFSDALGTPQVRARRLDSDSITAVNAGSSHDLGKWTMFLVYANWSTRRLEIWVDGDLEGFSTALGSSGGNSDSTSSSEAIVMCGASQASTAISLAYVAMGAIKAGSLDTTTIDKMFGWAAHHYGLTANLDVSHPYKSSPP